MSNWYDEQSWWEKHSTMVKGSLVLATLLGVVYYFFGWEAAATLAGLIFGVVGIFALLASAAMGR